MEVSFQLLMLVANPSVIDHHGTEHFKNPN